MVLALKNIPPMVLLPVVSGIEFGQAMPACEIPPLSFAHSGDRVAKMMELGQQYAGSRAHLPPITIATPLRRPDDQGQKASSAPGES
jgi:hypothetical protein